MEKAAAVQAFIENDQLDWQVVGEGVKRKIMSYDDRLMLVKVSFEKGSIGTLHQHYHTQITHVESGAFEVEIDGVKKVLKGGDAFYITPNVMHGVVCLEAGVLIDVFSPMREDFV
jgi:quercetin dioxygenase-like cupin family protein